MNIPQFVKYLLAERDWVTLTSGAVAFLVFVFFIFYTIWIIVSERRAERMDAIRRGESRGYYYGRRDERSETVVASNALPMIFERDLNGSTRRRDR